MELLIPKGRNQNRLVTLVVALTGAMIVAGLLRFNHVAQGYEYYLAGNSLALFFIPMMVIFLILGEDPSDFGFGVGNSKKMRWWTLILFAALLVVLVPASRRAEFRNYYPIFKQFVSFHSGVFSEKDIWGLIYGWASYGMYLFFWEFFFRGYLLFGLSRTIKWPAVIIQAAAFGVLHWGKVPSEVAASFGAGIILGMLALKSKSFLPCFALHWLASVTFDVLILIQC